MIRIHLFPFSWKKEVHKEKPEGVLRAKGWVPAFAGTTKKEVRTDIGMNGNGTFFSLSFMLCPLVSFLRKQ